MVVLPLIKVHAGRTRGRQGETAFSVQEGSLWYRNHNQDLCLRSLLLGGAVEDLCTHFLALTHDDNHWLVAAVYSCSSIKIKSGKLTMKTLHVDGYISNIKTLCVDSYTRKRKWQWIHCTCVWTALSGKVNDSDNRVCWQPYWETENTVYWQLTWKHCVLTPITGNVLWLVYMHDAQHPWAECVSTTRAQ